MGTASAPPLERLGPEELRAAMAAYRDVLRAHQEAVNRLNVYPVPDGDTGTNMALTVESVVSAVVDADDMAATCQGIAKGSLMGARGNSGVILSQVLRGLSERWRALESVGPPEVAEALAQASEAAYGAVMRPVEGTILTVVRAAAEGATEAADAGKALVDVLDAARRGAAEALERTPDLLEVLRQAGVVDAGGAGLVLLLDALLHVAAGRALPEPDVVATPRAVEAHAGAGEAAADGSLRYEVMYLLEAPDDAVPAFKEAWARLGDSIVVVGGDGLWNCHIHTDDIGGALEAALDHGRPRDIRVTDLTEQVEEERWVREAGGVAPEREASPRPGGTAVVVVAAGSGVHRIFESLGAHRALSGGPSMNPSTAEILEAVEAVPADEVVVLPNDKNVVAVSEAVDGLTAKTVRVVPTRSVPEGLAAVLAFDPEVGVDENVGTMAEAASHVVWGEVTQAVRASSCEVGPIEEGAWLGISPDGIEVVASTVVDATTGLLARLVGPDHEVVTVIEGDGAAPDDTRAVGDWLAEHHPDVGVEVHRGGQPFYPYLLSVE